MLEKTKLRPWESSNLKVGKNQVTTLGKFQLESWKIPSKIMYSMMQ